MYNVIVLAEQVMTRKDAVEVVSLHEGVDDTRHYHVLIPCDDASVRVEEALGSLAASETMTPPPFQLSDRDTQSAQSHIDADAQDAVALSVSTLESLGHRASGEYSHEDPIDTLDRVVHRETADEVIVMTRPHVVQEFLHLDWASKARRRLGVPVLHLVEHEPLEAGADNGQGITGM